MMALWIMLLSLLALNNAAAFYDPTIGRWISRDPIEEDGGRNLALFVSNDAVSTVDPFGLVGMGEYRMHCCGAVWNEKTHCCDGKGHVVPRNKKMPTGVVTHTWKANPTGTGKYHVWLTWDGGSADSNGDSVIFEPGDRKISSPAAAMPAPIFKSDPLELSPCEYDFDKLNACLSNKGATLNGQRGGLCSELPPKWIEECKSASKK